MPKLTPEEKRLLRIEKKLQKKLEKEERQRQIKRDHLQREIDYGRKTLKKYEKIWREMLIKMSLPNLRKDMEFAWHNFQRIIDVKDFTISLLMDELSYAEEQYLRNFSHHTEQIDNLHRLFSEYLDSLRDEFESSLKKMRDDLGEFADNIRKAHEANCFYLNSMIDSGDANKLNQDKSMKIEYYSRMETEQTERETNLEKLKVYLENRYLSLFHQMRNFIDHFHKMVKKRKNDYDLMKATDDEYKAIINEQAEKLEKSYEFIGNLKDKFSNIKRIGDGKLTNLMIERDGLLANFYKLKDDLKLQIKNDDHKIILLTEHCNNSEEYLGKWREKGENLLHFVTTCQDLETNPEIPQYPDGIIVDKMELFWQKFGQIKYENLEISKEISMLKQENQQLLKKLSDTPDYRDLIQPKSESINIVDCNSVLKQYKKWQK